MTLDHLQIKKKKVSSITRLRYGTIAHAKNASTSPMEDRAMSAELEPKKLALIRTLQILEADAGVRC